MNFRALTWLIILCLSGFCGTFVGYLAEAAESGTVPMRGGSVAETSDRRVGERAAAQIAQEMGIVEEGPATAYVRELG